MPRSRQYSPKSLIRLPNDMCYKLLQQQPCRTSSCTRPNDVDRLQPLSAATHHKDNNCKKNQADGSLTRSRTITHNYGTHGAQSQARTGPPRSVTSPKTKLSTNALPDGCQRLPAPKSRLDLAQCSPASPRNYCEKTAHPANGGTVSSKTRNM